MKTWTCKVEWMTGVVGTVEVKAATKNAAATELWACYGPSIANLIAIS